MVVPYGDPNEPHYRKNAFDAGEDGLGKNAHSLKKVCFIQNFTSYCINSNTFLTINILVFNYRDVIVQDTSSTLMHILQTSLEALKQLKIVYVCMKKTMESSGSIKIGELVQRKSEDPGALQFLLFVLLPIMNTVFTGTFTRSFYL